MQHVKPLLPLISLAALVVAATAEASPEEAACQQLSDALTRELAILRTVQDSASATASIPQLKTVLDELATMDRSYEAEKALWEYIDNTEGVKLPMVELLQRLTIELYRLEKAHFYMNKEFYLLLKPQVWVPQSE